MPKKQQQQKKRRCKPQHQRSSRFFALHCQLFKHCQRRRFRKAHRFLRRLPIRRRFSWPSPYKVLLASIIVCYSLLGSPPTAQGMIGGNKVEKKTEPFNTPPPPPSPPKNKAGADGQPPNLNKPVRKSRQEPVRVSIPTPPLPPSPPSQRTVTVATYDPVTKEHINRLHRGIFIYPFFFSYTA